MTQLLLERQVETSDEMHELGIAIARLLRAGDLLVLTGPLGAGKTTLSRGIGEGLGATGTVSSPTFVIARTHKTVSGTDLVHVDAYRLGSAAELDDLDIDFRNSITLIEWGSGLTDCLAADWLDIEIDRDHTGSSDVRTIRILGEGARWEGITL